MQENEPAAADELAAEFFDEGVRVARPDGLHRLAHSLWDRARTRRARHRPARHRHEQCAGQESTAELRRVLPEAPRGSLGTTSRHDPPYIRLDRRSPGVYTLSPMSHLLRSLKSLIAIVLIAVLIPLHPAMRAGIAPDRSMSAGMAMDGRPCPTHDAAHIPGPHRSQAPVDCCGLCLCCVNIVVVPAPGPEVLAPATLTVFHPAVVDDVAPRATASRWWPFPNGPPLRVA
jgi:hypothetical protein